MLKKGRAVLCLAQAIARLPKGLDKLLGERLSKRGIVPEGDRLNYTVKVKYNRLTVHPNS